MIIVPVSPRTKHFIRAVISVLPGIKDSPAIPERTRMLGSEQTVPRWITIRHMKTGDFVIPIVLKTGESAESGIESRRGIAPLRQHADRLICRIAVIDPDVEHEGGIEGVSLSMQRITGIFDEHNGMRRQKAGVIKPGMCEIALIQHRELARVAGWPLQSQPHDRPKASVIHRFRQRVGIAGFIKIEFSEFGPWTELPVLRTLERRGPGAFGERIRIERGKPLNVRVVDDDPLGIEHFSIRMEIAHVVRQDISIDAVRVEHNRSRMDERQTCSA